MFSKTEEEKGEKSSLFKNISMLARKWRLNKREFDKVFKEGRTALGRFVVVKFLKNSLVHWRFSVVVPKKIEKSVVKRNMVKRRVYDVLGRIPNQNTAGFDVVVLVKNPNEVGFYNEIRKILIENVAK